MGKEDNNNNFALLGIVALVAIVGLIVGMHQGTTRVISTDSQSNLGGNAYRSSSNQVVPIEPVSRGHWEYRGNFTVNSTTRSSVDDCSYFWDNYDAFHEGGVDYLVIYNNSDISNMTNSSYREYDICLSGSTLREYSCEYSDTNQSLTYVVVTEGTCSEGCFEDSSSENTTAYCKKTKVWVNDGYQVYNSGHFNNYQID